MNRIRVLQAACAPVEVAGQVAGITGPERRAANLAPRWQELGLDVVIAYPQRGALWGELEATGLTLVDFELRGWRDFAGARRIKEVARVHRVDLIHSQGGAALDLACVRAARSLGIASLVTRPVMIADNVNRSRLARAIHGTVDRHFTLRLADGVVAVSKDGFDRLAPVVGRQRLHLVHNGVKPFAGSAGGALPGPVARHHVGMIGHLLDYKGWDDFLRVAKVLSDDGHDVAWHIVGEGPERASLEAMARDFGIADRVLFHGLLHDVTPVLAALDLFLFTSHREGLSVAVLEAMSAGLPLVATDVGGIADQVIEGENGFIVPDGDVAAAAARVCMLVTDDALRERMGAASRQRMEAHFSEQAMLSNYTALYRQLAR
ncbi:glycosyltransferase family 4 protein [Sphingomonas suaedae]|uniref:Glycosyltransferase family 4 protein n=1 Tax=Sphingomonas suaedae TaxID=2599297 RepID=A0A518RJ47_9SPHN|nr:glycosyltransferase family 4 protein [Sphingomonas suaedae]QDX27463.1 glycosyltransferase family 4 protein [Sphingomonas suaedae]